jgi:hypothetical protein
VLHTPLRLAAIACSLVLALGWSLFALDETRSAAEASAERVAGKPNYRSASPTPREEQLREEAHGDVRELIDDADDVLLSPFAGVAGGSENIWVQRTVPALLGLIAYGFGLGYLSRFSRGRSR